MSSEKKKMSSESVFFFSEDIFFKSKNNPFTGSIDVITRLFID